MGERLAEKLLPMTILDGMVFVAGSAVSIWLLASVKDEGFLNLLVPQSRSDWLVLTAFVEYGPTIMGPVVLLIQFLRGRRRRLFPGEVAWLVIGVELLPFLLFWWVAIATKPAPEWLDLLAKGYIDGWLIYCSPPLVLLCAVGAVVWHFRRGKPRHWSHRVGMGVALAQCVPSTLIMINWFE